MKVLVDAHMLGTQEGGNETYIAGLIKGFQSIQLPPAFHITALYNRHFLPPPQHNDIVRFWPLNAGSNFARLFQEIPRMSQQHASDLLHVTYNASPFLRCPLIVSVHDVAHRIFPAYFSPRVRLLLSTLLPLTLAKARLILTISETSRHDIAHFYPFAAHKIHVTPLAPGSVVEVEPDFAAAERLHHGYPFFLAVGSVQPRKNLVRLVQAYLEARHRGTIHQRLLIVGRDAWQSKSIRQTAQQSPHADDIQFTGYVAEATLAALYRHCTAFIYPSLYEGFGLPVVEAMACGAPVITSNLSSLPEVAADAALLVNPNSVNEMAHAIEQVANHVALRAELRQRGFQRASTFSWQRTAKMTYDLYHEAIRQKS